MIFFDLLGLALGLGVLYLLIIGAIKLTDKLKVVETIKRWLEK